MTDVTVKKLFLEDPKVQHRRLRPILQRREWTFLLDCIVAIILGTNFTVLVFMYFRLESYIPGQIIAVLYILLKDAYKGTSPAKALMGLQVVDAATGTPIGVWKSAKRNFLMVLPLVCWVELLVANVRKDTRRLGDHIAGTMVVRQ